MSTRSVNLLSELGRTAREAARTWNFLPGTQKASLAAAVVLMAGVGYLTARIPLLLGELVDAMLSQQVRSLGEAAGFLYLLAATYLLRELLQVSRKVVVERTCTTIEKNATIAAVSQLLRADLADLGAERAGTLNGRLNRSVEGLVRLLKLSFLDLFPAAFGAAFALSAALTKNWMLGLVMAAVVPVGLLVILIQLTSQRGIRLSLLRAKERMDGTVVEQLGGIEYVRAAHTVDLEMRKVADISEELRRREFKHHFAMSLFDGVKSINEGGFHIAVIAFAIWLSLMQAITTGDILAFSMLFVAVITPLREIHRIVDEAHESSLRAADFFRMIEQPQDRSFAAPTSQAAPAPTQTIIEAKDLEICYHRPDAGVTRALHGVSVNILQGQFLGLAGPSGSGKTTFARALLRLAHPSSGILRVGGRPIESISREEIGHLFGFVSQKPFLFTGTVAENIAYGHGQATTEEIERAARLAHISDEIERLPKAYGFEVTERGGNLSGGQCQRIALARIFLQNPPILILDEATAALDNENERAVMAAISNAAQGRTVLMIAHRLTSLERADNILVFKDGQIAEQGSFANLSKIPGGIFANLLFGASAGRPSLVTV